MLAHTGPHASPPYFFAAASTIHSFTNSAGSSIIPCSGLNTSGFMLPCHPVTAAVVLLRSADALFTGITSVASAIDAW